MRTRWSSSEEQQGRAYITVCVEPALITVRIPKSSSYGLEVTYQVWTWTEWNLGLKHFSDT